MGDRASSPSVTTVFLHEFVTGGGLAGEALPPSWAAEGRAMRRALAEDFAALDGVTVVMTLDARLPDEPGPWRVVRVGAGEEAGAFARLADESDFTLSIAPETGGVLEERALWIERAGGRSLGCSAEAIALCGDKLRLGEHLRGRGIATPESRRVRPSEGLPRDFPYPAVVKPIDGAGSLDTYLVESPDDPPPGVSAMPEAMLQPLVRGVPMSAAFLVTPNFGASLVGLADQTIETVGGAFVYRGGVAPSRVGVGRGGLIPARHAYGDSPLLRAACSVPGLLGWVGVDFVWDEARGAIVVLEINPRPTTSYVGFRRAVAPHLEPRLWMVRLWLNQIDMKRPKPLDINIWCRRMAHAPPIAFSADGTILDDGEGGRP